MPESNTQKEDRRKVAMGKAIESFGFRDPTDSELISRATKIENFYKGES